MENADKNTCFEEKGEEVLENELKQEILRLPWLFFELRFEQTGNTLQFTRWNNKNAEQPAV